MLNLSTVVRIAQLTQSTEDYNGWGTNQRAPKIGDVGAIIDVLKADHLPDKYVVEHEGHPPEWLSEFWENELEVVT